MVLAITFKPSNQKLDKAFEEKIKRLKTIKIVSKEWAEKRQKENIPLWDGWVLTMPTKDYSHIVITLYNKSNAYFYEKFMYANENKLNINN